MRSQALFRTSMLVLALVAATTAAHAQATRTWVSGVGDDANPCSRTAPCKTFAGAISKTATGGEINVLDPGGFGAVTITKSITISSESSEAGVLVSGTNGIVISAGGGDNVVLRGLDIEGLGNGLDGIKVLGALASLSVEKCTISDFRGSNGTGIEIAPTTAGTTKVFVTDSILRSNGAGTGGGILIDPGAGVTVRASLQNVRMYNNQFGLKIAGTGPSDVMVQGSVASGNAFAGFSVANANSQLQIEHSTADNNGTGLVCAAGTMLVGNTSLFQNTAATSSGGTCKSYKNNDSDSAFAFTQAPQS
jgi:hypothetical protein